LRASKFLEEGLDPRVSALERRLSSIKLIAPVMSPKGGVGKTLISVMLSLALTRRGIKVGLLDLDITNPTAHMVLGVDIEKTKPVEDEGIIPPSAHGICFMTIAYYSGEEPLPLRGVEIDDVIKEVLTVTSWKELHVLLLDLPPGLSDEALDILKFLKRAKPIVVTTPDALALNSAKKLLKLLQEGGVKPLGVIENMSSNVASAEVKKLCEAYSVDLIGTIPFDSELRLCLGKVDSLLKTRVAKSIEAVAENVLKKIPP